MKSAPAQSQTTVRGALCGPKYLRGVVASCDGSCCGMINGKVDPALTAKLNNRIRLNERNDSAWRRILSDRPI